MRVLSCVGGAVLGLSIANITFLGLSHAQSAIGMPTVILSPPNTGFTPAYDTVWITDKVFARGTGMSFTDIAPRPVQCRKYNGAPARLSASEKYLRFEIFQSTSQVDKFRKQGVFLSGNYGPVRASASVTKTDLLREQNNILSIGIQMSVYRDEILDFANFSRNSDLPTDPGEFQKRCGEFYVSGYKYGKHFSAISELRFESREKKDEFAAAVGISGSGVGWGFTVDASHLERSLEKYSQSDTKIEIIAAGELPALKDLSITKFGDFFRHREAILKAFQDFASKESRLAVDENIIGMQISQYPNRSTGNFSAQAGYRKLSQIRLQLEATQRDLSLMQLRVQGGAGAAGLFSASIDDSKRRTITADLEKLDQYLQSLKKIEGSCIVSLKYCANISSLIKPPAGIRIPIPNYSRPIEVDISNAGSSRTYVGTIPAGRCGSLVFHQGAYKHARNAGSVRNVVTESIKTHDATFKFSYQGREVNGNRECGGNIPPHQYFKQVHKGHSLIVNRCMLDASYKICPLTSDGDIRLTVIYAGVDGRGNGHPIYSPRDTTDFRENEKVKVRLELH